MKILWLLVLAYIQALVKATIVTMTKEKRAANASDQKEAVWRSLIDILTPRPHVEGGDRRKCAEKLWLYLLE